MSKKPRANPPAWEAADAANQFAAALQLHPAGDLRAAEQHYRRALAADPRHVDSLHYLGVLAQQVGHSEAAVELIGKALALNDRVPEMHYNLGLACAALGRFDEAEAHNRRAIALRPDYAEAHLNLGNTLNARGQGAKAIASYRQALVLKPTAEAHYNLANALAALDQTGDAIAHYQAALSQRPDYAEAHNNLGTLLLAQGKAAEAVAHHQRALALTPNLAAAAVNLAHALSALGRRDEAIAALRHALASDPNQAEVQNNLGAALLGRGEVTDAVACFERALALQPDLTGAAVNLVKALIIAGELERALRLTRELHDRQETAETRALFFFCLRDPRSGPHAAQYRNYLIRAIEEPWGSPRPLTLVATDLIKRNPAISAAIAQVEAAWPGPPADRALDSSTIASIAADPLLRTLLESVQNNDVALERLLTALRAQLLESAAQGSATADTGLLAFHCALARQCFINEYVFAGSAQEADTLAALRQRVDKALGSGAPIPPVWIAAIASYAPLHRLGGVAALSTREWPQPLRAVLRQQVDEPAEEARHRAAMPRLTEIKDLGSQAVRAQYEENPYPRWTKLSPTAKPQTVDNYLRERFPNSRFRPLGKPIVEYLIAGCGAGQQVASVAQVFSHTRITAIDLSLASLSYAKRMTAALGFRDIEFGQADILELGSLGRGFDAIDSSGVLHHVSDDYAGWRVLLSLLRPGGVMRVALYSTLARRDIEAARRYIAARGLRATAADIRLCRQEIMAMPEGEPARNAMTLIDFFSLSDCRDLLFHVQERTSTIEEIAEFLQAEKLEFLGFETEPGTAWRYAQRFPDDPARVNLAYWHRFEQDNPDTFIAMYEFWIQKPA